jgi:uncharacterized NAD(P)/FAD-binding protein YdhS
VTLHLEGGPSVVADAAVLALGNFAPPAPPVANRAALEGPRWASNPWAPGLLDRLAGDDPVCLIGTGQTTTDLLVTLHRRGHRGRVVAISRRGLLPLAHGRFDTYPSFFREIERSPNVLRIFRVVRAHLDRAVASGIDERAVIDSLRADTQTIWRSLPDGEKRRFVRHVFRFWEIIRSRIPPKSAAVVETMRAAGQLEVVAGRVVDLVETDGAMEVHFVPRGGDDQVVEAVSLVIDCVGPESDYRRIDDPLVRNLLERGLIRPGPADLGMDALPDGAIVGRDGSASDLLFTLGSTMRGVLWEVLAVTEIRAQAERLARHLVGAPAEPPDRLVAHNRIAAFPTSRG